MDNHKYKEEEIEEDIQIEEDEKSDEKNNNKKSEPKIEETEEIEDDLMYEDEYESVKDDLMKSISMTSHLLMINVIVMHVRTIQELILDIYIKKMKSLMQSN